MTITPQTKISALIKANPEVIDAIASINAHFKKLHNPFLRKVLASRVTIAEAAKIGKVDISLFFELLKPLGFVCDNNSQIPVEQQAIPEIAPPDFECKLDVRPDIEIGEDPFLKILDNLSKMEVGTTLLLVNSFEPVPLIRILEDKKFEMSVFHVTDNEVHTYIKKINKDWNQPASVIADNVAFDNLAKLYECKMDHVDVRTLPMPQPMLTILKSLEALGTGMALFVHHKKVPMMLLPELTEKKFSYAIKHVDSEVHLIIYRQDAQL